MKGIQGPSTYRMTGHLKDFQESPLLFLRHLSEYGETTRFRLGHRKFYLTTNPQMVKDVVFTKNNSFVDVGIKNVVRALHVHDLFEFNFLLGMPNIKSSFVKKHFSTCRIDHRTIIQSYLSLWKSGSLRIFNEEVQELALWLLAHSFFGVTQNHDLTTHLKKIAELRTKRHQPSMVKVRLPKVGKQNQIETDAIAGVVSCLQSRYDNQLVDEQRYIYDTLVNEDESGILQRFFITYDLICNACSWLMYTLCEHEDILRHVQLLKGHEQDEYMRMVILESLRLYPPIWLFGKQAVETVQVDNYVFKKNETIFISPYSLHRNEAYFLEPHEFLPERFCLDLNVDIPKHLYLPFGMIAETEAQMEYVMTMARAIVLPIVTSFDIKKVRSIIHPKGEILLEMKEPFSIVITKEKLPIVTSL
ncbi:MULTISPECIES: cytochrome P450 [Bacillaceae]|uniref:cytochrome P450 n=1 Tax=Bacillaceae TaxID=186817 RepID=UPI00140496CB|nr:MULTISPECIES: cytochrome P450 [Bacillaceae]MDT2047202.1 cytochrome P450 [Priestia flexa]